MLRQHSLQVNANLLDSRFRSSRAQTLRQLSTRTYQITPQEQTPPGLAAGPQVLNPRGPPQACAAPSRPPDPQRTRTGKIHSVCFCASGSGLKKKKRNRGHCDQEEEPRVPGDTRVPHARPRGQGRGWQPLDSALTRKQSGFARARGTAGRRGRAPSPRTRPARSRAGPPRAGAGAAPAPARRRPGPGVVTWEQEHVLPNASPLPAVRAARHATRPLPAAAGLSSPSAGSARRGWQMAGEGSIPGMRRGPGRAAGRANVVSFPESASGPDFRV